MKNFIIASIFATMLVAYFACGKTTEKTVTIIKEKDVPQENTGIQFKIKGSEGGIEVNTGN